jgi:acetoin utilization deacetylase AcuC-like enzyme
VNACLKPHAKSEDFQKAVDKFIPILDSFKPDMLILSAGFDGHRKDPTSKHGTQFFFEQLIIQDNGMDLEEKDFFELTEKLKKVAEAHAGGKIVSVLEGGYHLPSLGRCLREHLVSLMKI